MSSQELKAATFRKRPVEIEAVQWDGSEEGAWTIYRAFMGGLADNGLVHVSGSAIELWCHTLEGNLRVSPKDWVIRGVKGEYYPCKPDIFAATYEAADTRPQSEAGLRGALEKLKGDSLDAICEVIGAPKQYNDGKSAMRDWFLARIDAALASSAVVGEIEHEKISKAELDKLFGGNVPILAMKLMFPDKSEPLTLPELRQLLAALSHPSAGDFVLVPRELWTDLEKATKVLRSILIGHNLHEGADVARQIIDDMTALSAAPLLSSPSVGWRDIENDPPPKDGSEIMVAGGRFHHPMDYGEDGHEMGEHAWLARWDGSRWEGEEKDGHDNNYSFTDLTHWMPKPKFLPPARGG